MIYQKHSLIQEVKTMPYFPPQVEVTQTQKTFSPTLIEPALSAAIVGPAYLVEYADSTVASPYTTYSGLQVTITPHNIQAGMTLDATSVYVDLVNDTGAVTGQAIGARLILGPSNLTFSGNRVIIPANAAWTGASIYLGYRAIRSDLSQLYLYDSISSIKQDFGDMSSMNPQGLALVTALANANSAVYSYATLRDGYNGLISSGVQTELTCHQDAQDAMTSVEVYAIAPLSVNSTVFSSYTSYVEACSVPTEKHERMVVYTPTIPWADANNPTSSTGKSTTATTISVNAASVGDRRTFYTFPDVSFISEVRHISTLSRAYVQAMYVNGFSTTVGVSAYLNERVNFLSTNSEPGYANYVAQPTPGIGEEITDSLWRALLSHANATGKISYNVLVPIPAGIVAASAVVGQISGKAPEAPLTNVPIAGISSMKFGSDWFTESQLNTIASGGVYILKQAKPTSSIVCRHQLSTDMSSIENRELSILTALDYSAKFYRNTVSTFIGRFVINNSSLNMVRISLKGASDLLKRQGVLNDAKVSSVSQDQTEHDTVLATVSVGLAYPLNYIDIDLVF